MSNKKLNKVAIIMGSQSDYSTMKYSKKVLQSFSIKCDVKIVSAHRTPKRMYEFASKAEKNNFKVIIAGAGGAAHLPGMMASKTHIPIIGVPIQTQALSGVDSLYSIVQMPRGFPVGTMAIGSTGASNAALMSLQILALNDANLAQKLESWRNHLSSSIPDEPQN